MLKLVQLTITLAMFNCEVVFSQAPTDLTAEQRFHDQVFYDVYITDNGIDDNITHFDSWEYIRDLALSDSKKYLYVWHKPQGGTQLEISVYDVPKRRMVAELAPGFGGELFWTQDEKIVHVWGCGTNCYTFVVYSHLLQNMDLPDLGVENTGGYEISPKKDYVLFYSMFSYSYSILSLNKLKVVASELAQDGAIESATFIGDYEVEVKVRDLLGTETARVIKILQTP